jgi:hypothetical protein
MQAMENQLQQVVTPLIRKGCRRAAEEREKSVRIDSCLTLTDLLT